MRASLALSAGLFLVSGCQAPPERSSGTTMPSDGLNTITCTRAGAGRSLYGKAAAVDSSYVLPGRVDATWATCRGTGYSFQVPGDYEMSVDRASEAPRRALEFTGPRVFVPTAPDRGPSVGPAYRITVANWANDSGRTAEEVVERVRREMNGHEFDVDSTSYVSPAEPVRFGELEALSLRPFCGDCIPTELYFVSPKRVVRVAYVLDATYPGDRDAQARLYELIASTFRWSEQ